MVAGAATHDQRRINILEDALGLGAEQAGRDRVRVDHHLQSVGDRFRLLEDLLLHVMPVLAKLHRLRRQLAEVQRALDGIALGVDNPRAGEAHFGAIAFLQVNHALCHLQQRGCVGGGEALAVAQSQQQRGSHARHHHAGGFGLGDHRDRVSANQCGDAAPYRIEQAAAGGVSPVGSHAKWFSSNG